MDHFKPAAPNDAMMRARSPNPARPGHSPEPRAMKSPTPEMGSQPHNLANNVRSPNLGVPGRDPEPSRTMRSPEPPRNMRSPEPARNARSPETSRDARSPESPRTFRSPEPNRSAKSPSPLPEASQNASQNDLRSNSHDTAMSLRTPAQIMAQMTEASKPAIPQRANSRRRSFMDGTRHLLRKKPSLQLDDEFSRSGTTLPIQNPSADGSPAKQPSSPGSIFRRLSSRRAHAMSMSHYSGSPTSTKFSSETPPLRENSPAHTRNGTRVPTQSSYGNLALLPAHEQMSPFANSFAQQDIPEMPPVPKPLRTDSPAKPKVPQIAPLRPVNTIPDDSEGAVNTAHPLLREARHANFGTRTSPTTPGISTPIDLPFLNENFAHSNPDLSQLAPEPMIPPKRSSSLVHDGNNMRNPILNDSAVELDDTRPQGSPTPDQSTPNASALNIITRSTTVPPPPELGIHPAHRTPDPNSTSTEVAPSPNLSVGSEFDPSGATPPPISTVRSPTLDNKISKPPARFPPNPPKLQTQNHPPDPSHQQPTSATSAQSYTTARDASPHPGTPVQTGKYATTSPTAAPFYLNPASSTALVDFLSTSPPPSPPLGPHPGTRTEPGTPASQSTTAFFTRAFVPTRPGEASPPPPGPGSSRARGTITPWESDERAMTMQSATPSGLHGGEKERKGSTSKWKTKFLAARERVETGRLRDRERKKSKDVLEYRHLEGALPGDANGGAAIGGVARGVTPEGGGAEEKAGYMGLGKDGNWISRKNFVRG